ncbi:MAG: ABC transporter substrate-binding protein [Chloroflexi bacterium]|nr:ABC transporter substrate-binding protein [Chloroflexota bacterium]
MTKSRVHVLWSLCAMAVLFLSAVSGCAPAAAPAPTTAAEKPAVPTAARAVTPTGPAAPAPTPKPALDTPRYGGIIIRAVNRDVASFDVHREQAGDASLTLFNIYEGLVRLHPLEHQKIERELAEKWDISSDGKAYTFKLHQDVKWHDGKPLTTEDVKHNLERMHNPQAFKTLAPRGQGLLTAVDKVETAGADTVKVLLKYPSASFLFNIATGWIAIQPKHILDARGDMRRDAVGTGPFKLKEKIPEVSLELQKNASYHNKGLPYLDGIKFYTIKDDATRFSAFRTAKVQMTFSGSKSMTASQGELVKRDMADKAIVHEVDGLTRYAITFNTKRKPWDDVRVRRAVDLAFDRQAAIKVNGRGYVGSIYPRPWGMQPAEVARLAGYRQPKEADMAEAKRLLSEAGLARGFETTIMSASGGTLQSIGEITKDGLAKIGIDVTINLMDITAINERADRGAFDMFSAGWTDTTGDPDETLFTYYITGGSRNRGEFSNKEIDALIDQQARTLDVKGRQVILAEIEKKVLEMAPSVITYWDIWQIGAWKEVRNFKPGPGIHPWGKLDQVWLAK